MLTAKYVSPPDATPDAFDAILLEDGSGLLYSYRPSTPANRTLVDLNVWVRFSPVSEIADPAPWEEYAKAAGAAVILTPRSARI